MAELIELVQAEEGGQVAHPGGNQPHDRGVSRAAKVLGFSRREVGRSLRIASITTEAKAKAIEVGFDKNQSVLLTIAEEEGVEAQLGKIDELTKATTSGSKASLSSKTKANKKASKEAAEASDQDNGSPPIVPDPGDQSDSERQSSDDLADVDYSKEKERLFSALKAAWNTAPQPVRKRFVKKVLHLNLDQIDDEIWTA